jgi:ribosomal protein L16 Arg81 hydroxylase
MSYRIRPIDTVEEIDLKGFRESYLQKRKPVVIKGYAKRWEAYTKWTFDYFKQVAGEQLVPLYDNSKVTATKKVNEPAAQMKFGQYLDLIAAQPTELRIFLFNIFKHIPSLTKDYQMPDLVSNFMDSFPMMFFGGAGSNVFLHYDIDMSHVFHTQFQGRKRALLFSPRYSRQLYHVPFSVHNIEDIDLDAPDFAKYPALKNVEGMEVVLEHGDLLFMPAGWWHYMQYLEGGFALSLRAFDSSLSRKLEGVYNLFVMRTVDNLLRQLFGGKWMDYKHTWAYERSNKLALG